MDEMEYVSHNTEPAASTTSQAQQTEAGSGAGAGAGPGAVQGTAQTQIQSTPAPVLHSHPQHHFQGQQQPRPSGCPYFRGAEHHQPSHLPLPPQHPQFPQQQQPSFHPHQPHSQLQSQPQPQIQHQGFLSNPQSRNTSSHYGAAHLHYDPVHAATNNWYPAVQWPPGPALHHHSRTSSSDTYFGNLSGHPQNLGSSALGVNSGGSASLHSLGLTPGQPSQHQLAHHEPFTPYFSRHHPPNGHRYSGLAPSVSSHGQNQGNNNNQSNTNSTQSSMNTMASQSGSQQQLPSQTNSRAPPAPVRLPIPSTQTQPPQSTTAMSGSGESTLDLATTRRTLFGNGESPRASTGNETGAALDGSRNATRTASASAFGGQEPPSTYEAGPALGTLFPGAVLQLPNPPERRRAHPTRVIPDFDSDDELDPLEDDQQALRFIEQFSMGGNFSREMGEAQVRAHQILRGQMPNKRVASKKALSQLQSVDMDSLEESERTCVICYNDFGVENPEGINEAPLRLPGCKHIFGDHCIKKWFEESDSCPYCRDKVPSEPIIPAGAQYIRDLYRQFPGRTALSGQGAPFGDLNMRITHRRVDYESPPPLRAFQTGDRRSPPSEASESRRRTRARHYHRTSSTAATAGSSRQNSSQSGSPSSTVPSQLQSSATRERFTTQRPYYPNTNNLARFSMPPMQPVQYQTPESLGWTSSHPVPPLPPHASAFGPMGNLDGTSSTSNSYQPPVLMGPSGTAVSAGGDPLPGPAQLDAYSQQLPSSASLPPVVASDGAPFGATTNPGPGSGAVRFSRPEGTNYMMQ
ncbi:hypothetical protein V8F20_008948 [Naviculisporaceae sp. PSN 640]